MSISQKRNLALVIKAIQDLGRKYKPRSINAHYFVQIVTEKSSQVYCSFQKKFWMKNEVNSGKPYAQKVRGNPEPSLQWAGRCRDYPVME